MITLDTSVSQLIHWGARGKDEIAQNCLTLIRTMLYEVAYDRTLGINPKYIGLPLHDAIPLMTAEIYRVIDEREPRARVQNVEFIGVDADGNMQFKVVIEI